jgi:hypothetical protein
MMNLLGGRGFIGACSPESEGLQQPTQIGQAGHVDCRRAERHRRAYGRIQHPGGKDDRDARFSLDNDDFCSRAPFRVKLPDPAAIQRVPAIMDLHFPADMGRMNAPLHLEEKIISSAVRMQVVSGQRRSTHS